MKRKRLLKCAIALLSLGLLVAGLVYTGRAVWKRVGPWVRYEYYMERASSQSAVRDWAAAEASYHQAIRAAQEMGRVAFVLFSLADLRDVYLYDGDLRAAKATLAQMVTLTERMPVPDNELLAAHLSELAEVDVSLGEYAEAEELLKRAVTYVDRGAVKDPNSVRAILERYVEFLEATGRIAEKEEVKRRLDRLGSYDPRMSGR